MIDVLQLNTRDGEREYKDSLLKIGNVSPFYLIDFFRYFSNGLENLICFRFFEKGDLLGVLPGYLKKINTEGIESDYFDFTSPYGYSGPVFKKNTTKASKINFWKELDNWYGENSVITEFIRFNLFGNQLEYSGEIFPTMLNIKGKIIPEAEQWKAFEHKVRKNIKKAQKENLTSSFSFLNQADDKLISQFYEVFLNTMKRTNANENFFYPLTSFKNFIKNNGSNSLICIIFFNDIPISSELLLIDKDIVFSFLGGTEEKYFEKRPNDFLKSEVISWARDHQKRYYVLGGGYGYEDGIYKYKRSFFPKDISTYYTGRKIINQSAYDQLVKARFGNDIPETTFFPLYRFV